MRGLVVFFVLYCVLATANGRGLRSLQVNKREAIELEMTEKTAAAGPGEDPPRHSDNKKWNHGTVRAKGPPKAPQTSRAVSMGMLASHRNRTTEKGPPQTTVLTTKDTQLKDVLIRESWDRRAKYGHAAVTGDRGSLAARRSKPGTGMSRQNSDASQYNNSWRQNLSMVQLSEEDLIKLKAIAIVFPQYHAIPENDKFWGKGFTEWTMLRPMPRVLNGITTRFPHEDIGQYNFLDLEHRKYMRTMADHFGIFGFCFYHYWFEDRPVMHKPLDLLLSDGEPNKPFFLTWANEPWSKRWDGKNDHVLLAQDYSNVQGNIAHFNYLLPFFKHKNYIHVNGLPLFAFYRIDKADEVKIDSIMELWTRLASEAGIGGLYFIRFLGAFKNRANLAALSGNVQFEPVYSWVRTTGGPSIFEGGKFNITVFARHNPVLVAELARKRIPLHSYVEMSRTYTNIISGQFKVYDKHLSWDAIENNNFETFNNTFRGTFCHWSNAPRRNFSNQEYANYPHMMSPDSLKGCRAHLERMAKIVVNDPNGPADKFLFLTAWNEWNEQSVFEPTDVEGYDALTALQSVVRTHTGRKILHVGCSKEENIVKYVTDLRKLFPHYTHVAPASLQDLGENVTLLHIHGRVDTKGAVILNVSDYTSISKKKGIRVCVTVHDLQFLFPNNPNPFYDSMSAAVPEKEDVRSTLTLFELADTVIFPSVYMKDLYMRHLNQQQIPRNFHVVPHNDVLIKHERLNIPAVHRNIVNVAFVGHFSPAMGSEVYVSLIRKMAKLKVSVGDAEKYDLRFHIYDKAGENTSCHVESCHNASDTMTAAKKDDIVYHGNSFSRSRVSIHILVYLPMALASYHYDLSRSINTGLPIVFLGNGVTNEQLNVTRSKRYFSAPRESHLPAAIITAAQFVVKNQGTTEHFYYTSKNLQPSKWYIVNYPG